MDNRKAEEKKYGGYISKIVLNDGTEIQIKKNDIVVFVGPNNAGKSQSLKDIYALCESNRKTTVIKDIEIKKYEGSIIDFLEKTSTIVDSGGNRNYSGIGYSLAGYNVLNYANNMYYGSARALFVTYLDTINRFSISNPANCITRKATKTNPIHYAAFDRGYREWLSQSFKSAFGKELIPYILNSANIPLCIGESVKLNNDFKDEEERQDAYAEILDTYMQVQDQGDGIKSFTGILLYLMIDYYCTFLIDEPESFLHPPQSNIMGQIIGQTLTEYQQAFISTHSEEIVKGLTQVCPDRVKIIRITRDGNTNKFSILGNETFNSVWNDPLLKYSNIMASLFHKNVVLCESDSDCKMYSIIENYNKLCRVLYSETLFIHCGGKHRMAKIVRALHSLDVDIRLIVDIDVLNDEKVFREITEAYSIDWESIKIDYKNIVSNLHSPKELINRYELKSLVEKICDASSEKYLTKTEMKQIKDAMATVSKWDTVKKGGMHALPAGDASSSYHKLNKKLEEAGIYMVQEGELECFVKQVGGHGPDWTNTVLETYPDLEDDVYKNIREFVDKVCM